MGGDTTIRRPCVRVGEALRADSAQQHRLDFARRFLRDQSVKFSDLLNVELYPWHSLSLTRAIRIQPDALLEFVALGHAGSEHYAGLEAFPNSGVCEVEMTSDELTAVCPITAQPDFYVARIVQRPDSLCLESKSLKLYLARFRNEGAFGEALAVQIRDDVAAALELGPAAVTVTLTQKARGGITITATA